MPKKLMTATDYKFLRDVAFAYQRKRIDAFRKKNLKFSYYTSADTALKIVQNKELWLRNTAVMNDFREIEHGAECLRYWNNNDSIKNRIKEVNSTLGLDLAVEQIIEDFDKTRSTDTYLLSLSEHGHKATSESLYGRLSMWRAYGGNTNVALIFNPEPLLADTETGVFNSPVKYGNAARSVEVFNCIADAVQKNIEGLSQLPTEKVSDFLSSSIHAFASSAKHAGFNEEKEWRLITSPKNPASSKFLERQTVTIEGVPQHVYKIKLEDNEKLKFRDVTPDKLINQVLIGPTQYPHTIKDALVAAMEDSGIGNASERVKISKIPLRR